MLRHINRNQLHAWPARTYRELVFETEIPLQKDPVLFVSDPELLKYILTQPERYPKSPLQNRLLRKGLGDGLLTGHGEHWRRQRRSVQPMFKLAHLKSLAPYMSDAIDQTLARWDNLPDGTQINIQHEMMMMTLDILRGAMFQRVDVDNEKMGWAVAEYLATFGRVDLIDYFALPEWLPRPKHWRVRAASNYFDKAVADILTQRRADRAPPSDLLQMMLEARDEESGKGLSDREIRDNLITFFLAGHETTALALSWAFYLLALHPTIEQNLHDQISNIDSQDASDFPYAQQIFEESMRLYPPVPMFDRVALEEDEVAGQRIKKGAHIFISPYVLHRHRRLWTNPNDFDPDRFSPEAVKARHRFQYLPFNAGPRACVGLNFALMEGTLAIVRIAKRYHLKITQTADPTPEALVTMRPKGGIQMTLHRRN